MFCVHSPRATCRSNCSSTPMTPVRFAVPSVTRNSTPMPMNSSPEISEVVCVCSGPSVIECPLSQVRCRRSNRSHRTASANKGSAIPSA
jgi:hypothetical protein